MAGPCDGRAIFVQLWHTVNDNLKSSSHPKADAISFFKTSDHNGIKKGNLKINLMPKNL